MGIAHGFVWGTLMGHPNGVAVLWGHPSLFSPHGNPSSPMGTQGMGVLWGWELN